MPRESGAGVSGQVQRMLHETLEAEDQRLVDLERRVGQMRAERSRAAARPPEPPPPPAPAAQDEALDLAEARRLVAESGSYLRELEHSIQALTGERPAKEASPAPPAQPPPPARPSGASQASPRQASSAQARLHDPQRHELGRVFAPTSAPAAGESEPAWTRAMVAAQERTLAALERLTETLLAARDAEALAMEERLAALEAAVGSTPPGRSGASPRGPEPAGVPPGISAALRARIQAEAPRPTEPARAALEGALRLAPPAAPPRREALLRLASEHQSLVNRQVQLLERLLGLVEP